MNFHSKFTRIVAGAVGFFFFGANCLFAYSTESNFWEEKRRARGHRSSSTLLASLRVGAFSEKLNSQFPSPRKFEDTLSLSVGHAIPKSFLTEHGALLAALSSAYGTIRKVSLGPNPSALHPIVIHIQDVHQNLEAQKNIGHLVGSLLKARQAGLIALEGTWGDIKLQPFRDFPNRKAVELSADYLLEKNQISGPIHAALVGTGPLPPLIGIDDPTHYNANVEAYRHSVPRLEALKKEQSVQKVDLDQEKKRVFTTELKRFDDAVESYRSGCSSLVEFVQALSNPKLHLAVPPSVQRFQKTISLERAIDFKQVENERTHLINVLVEKLSRQEIEELTARSVAYRSGEVSYANFYSYLQAICSKSGVSLITFPAMKEYIQYVLLADGISAETLFGDLIRLESTVYSKLATTQEARGVVKKARSFYLAGKLMDFGLTPEEWKEYRALPIANPSLSTFENFYREADARDIAMASNLLKGISANKTTGPSILVTGGYHSPGLTSQLVQSGATVISVVPKIEKLETTQGSTYLSVFTQEKTPLDQLFSGDKLFLSQEPVSEKTRVMRLPALVAVSDGGTSYGSIKKAFAHLVPAHVMSRIRLVVETVREGLNQISIHFMQGPEYVASAATQSGTGRAAMIFSETEIFKQSLNPAKLLGEQMYVVPAAFALVAIAIIGLVTQTHLLFPIAGIAGFLTMKQFEKYFLSIHPRKNADIFGLDEATYYRYVQRGYWIFGGLTLFSVLVQIMGLPAFDFQQVAWIFFQNVFGYGVLYHGAYNFLSRVPAMASMTAGPSISESRQSVALGWMTQKTESDNLDALGANDSEAKGFYEGLKSLSSLRSHGVVNLLNADEAGVIAFSWIHDGHCSLAVYRPNLNERRFLPGVRVRFPTGIGARTLGLKPDRRYDVEDALTGVRLTGDYVAYGTSSVAQSDQNGFYIHFSPESHWVFLTFSERPVLSQPVDQFNVRSDLSDLELREGTPHVNLGTLSRLRERFMRDLKRMSSSPWIMAILKYSRIRQDRSGRPLPQHFEVDGKRFLSVRGGLGRTGEDTIEQGSPFAILGPLDLDPRLIATGEEWSQLRQSAVKAWSEAGKSLENFLPSYLGISPQLAETFTAGLEGEDSIIDRATAAKAIKEFASEIHQGGGRPVVDFVTNHLGLESPLVRQWASKIKPLEWEGWDDANTIRPMLQRGDRGQLEDYLSQHHPTCFVFQSGQNPNSLVLMPYAEIIYKPIKDEDLIDEKEDETNNRLMQQNSGYHVYYRTPGDRRSRILLAYADDGNYSYPDVIQLNYVHPNLRKCMAESLRVWASLGVNVRADLAFLALRDHVKGKWFPGLPQHQFNLLYPEEFWAEVFRGTYSVRKDFQVMGEIYDSGHKHTLTEIGLLTYDMEHTLKLLVDLKFKDFRRWLKNTPPWFLRGLVGSLRNHDDPIDIQNTGLFRHQNRDEVVRAILTVQSAMPNAPITLTRLLLGQYHKVMMEEALRLDDEPVRLEEWESHVTWRGGWRKRLTPFVENGEYKFLSQRHNENENIIAQSWELDGETMVVITNLSENSEAASLDLPPGLSGRIRDSHCYRALDLYDEDVPSSYVYTGAQLKRDGLYVNLPPWKSHVLYFSKSSDIGDENEFPLVNQWNFMPSLPRPPPASPPPSWPKKDDGSQVVAIEAIYRLSPPHGKKPQGIGKLTYLKSLIDSTLVPAGATGILLLPFGPLGRGGVSPYAYTNGVDPLLIDWTDVPDVDTATRASHIKLIGDIPPFEQDLLFRERVRARELPVGENWENTIGWKAYQAFLSSADGQRRRSFGEYKRRNGPWLDRYGKFEALTEIMGKPPTQASSLELAVAVKDSRYGRLNGFYEYAQWVALEQLKEATAYGLHQGVHFLFDRPFYYGKDSPEVWAHRDLFHQQSPGVYDMTKGKFVEWGDLIQPDFSAMERGEYSLLLEPFAYLLAEAGFSGVRLDAGDRYATAGIETEHPLLHTMTALLNQYGAVAVAEAFGRSEDKQTLTDNGVVVMEDGFWEWGKNSAGALGGHVAVQLDSHDLPGITTRAGLREDSPIEARKRAVLSTIERALNRGPAFLLLTLGNLYGDPTRINVGNTVNRTNWRDMRSRREYDLVDDIRQLISGARRSFKQENLRRDKIRSEIIASANQVTSLFEDVQAKCEMALTGPGTEFTWRRHHESEEPHQFSGSAGLKGLMDSYRKLRSDRGWVSSITHHATQGDLFKHTIGILFRAELDLAHWSEGKPFWDAIAKIIGLQEWPHGINSTESAVQLIDRTIADDSKRGRDSWFFEFRDELLMLFLENSLVVSNGGKTFGQEREPNSRSVEALVRQEGFHEWFSAQRYYLNKGQVISEISVEDLLFRVPATEDKPAIYGCILRVKVRGGEDSLYYVPLALSSRPLTDVEGMDPSIVNTGTVGDLGSVYFAPAEHTLFYQEMVRKMMIKGEEIKTSSGRRLNFETPPDDGSYLRTELAKAQPLPLAMATSNALTVVTNTSDQEWILKTLRRFEGDTEAEMVAALRDGNFQFAPQSYGIAYYETVDGRKYPLWFAMEKISGPPNSSGEPQGARTIASIIRPKVVDNLRHFEEGKESSDFLGERITPTDENPMTGRKLFEKIGKSLVIFFVCLADSSRAGFGRRNPTEADAKLLAQGPIGNINSAMALLNDSEHPGFDVVRHHLAQLKVEITQSLIDMTGNLDNVPKLGRVSGDNHFDQMVLNGDDICLLDFGGSPAASIDDRRRMVPGVTDLGGLLSSLNYIQFFALRDYLNVHRTAVYTLPDVFNLLTGTNDEKYSDQDRKLARYSDRMIDSMAEALIETYIREIVSQGATAYYLEDWDPQTMMGWIHYSLLSRASYEINYEISARPETGNVVIPMYSLTKWSKLSKVSVPSTRAGRMSLFVGSERYEQTWAALWERPIFSLLTLGTAFWIVTVLLGPDTDWVNEFVIATGLVGSGFSLLFSLHPKGPNGEERALGLNPLLLHGQAFSIALALALGGLYLGIPVMGVVWIFSLAYTITGTYLHLVYDRIHPKWGRIPLGGSSQSSSSSEAYGREMRRLLTENPLAPSLVESFPHEVDLGVRELGAKEYSFRLRMSEKLPEMLNDPMERERFHFGLGKVSPTVSRVFAALAGGLPGEANTLIQLVENDSESIQRAEMLARLVETANDPLMQLVLIADSPQVGNRMSSFSGDHVSIGAPGMKPVSIREGSRVYLRTGNIPKTKASAMIRGAGLPDPMVSLLLDLLADPQKNIPFHILLNAAIAVAASA